MPQACGNRSSTCVIGPNPRVRFPNASHGICAIMRQGEIEVSMNAAETRSPPSHFGKTALSCIQEIAKCMRIAAPLHKRWFGYGDDP